jgi:hypothetical protein
MHSKIALLGVFLMLAIMVSSVNATTYECDSCASCSDYVENVAISGDTILLNTTIEDSCTIDMSAGQEYLTFDCDWKSIAGSIDGVRNNSIVRNCVLDNINVPYSSNVTIENIVINECQNTFNSVHSTMRNITTSVYDESATNAFITSNSESYGNIIDGVLAYDFTCAEFGFINIDGHDTTVRNVEMYWEQQTPQTTDGILISTSNDYVNTFENIYLNFSDRVLGTDVFVLYPNDVLKDSTVIFQGTFAYDVINTYSSISNNLTIDGLEVICDYGFCDGAFGVVISDTLNTTIKNSRFVNIGNAISLTETGDPQGYHTIQNVIVENSTTNGILIEHLDYNVVRNVTMRGSSLSITAGSGDYNEVTDSYFDEESTATSGGSNNVFCRNSVYGSADGFYSYDCDGLGNYWVANTECVDSSPQDGICDDEYGDDQYPLAENTDKPIIIIYSPLNQSYATTSITLSVSSSKLINTWYYSLNGSGAVEFTPNTTIIAVNGSLNNIMVFGNDTLNQYGLDREYFGVYIASETPPLEQPSFYVTIRGLSFGIIGVFTILIFIIGILGISGENDSKKSIEEFIMVVVLFVMMLYLLSAFMT